MMEPSPDAYRPSLRRTVHVVAVVLAVMALAVAGVSYILLRSIASDATHYQQEIPFLLKQNRNAIKVERLSSGMQAISLTQAPDAERRLLIQIQTLAQTFVFESDRRLNTVAVQAAGAARKIVAIHAALRQLATQVELSQSERDATSAELGQQIATLQTGTLKSLHELTDLLTTDAALVADRLAVNVKNNAVHVQTGGSAAFAFFVLVGIGLFWVMVRHVLRPITMAVRGLQAIARSDAANLNLPRARFLELDMIGRAVEDYARFARDLRCRNAALRQLSEQDGLTGVANRRSFDVALARALDTARAENTTFALLMIDVDLFKVLNDQYGHLAGDDCLRQLGTILSTLCCRPDDHVARYGGEEFGIILRSETEGEAVAQAERLRAAAATVRPQASGSQRAIEVTVSIGVACFGADSFRSAEGIVQAADNALYRAKREGRNCVRSAQSADIVRVSSRSAA